MSNAYGFSMQDNNIAFWQKLVHNYFEPGALKRWCLSSYNTSPVGRHAQGLFPMVLIVIQISLMDNVFKH